MDLESMLMNILESQTAICQPQYQEKRDQWQQYLTKKLEILSRWKRRPEEISEATAEVSAV